MARTRKQFALTIIAVEDLVARKNDYVFNEQDLDLVFKKSKRLLVSENRAFRMFCKTTEQRGRLLYGEDGRIIRNDDGGKEYEYYEVASAREFTVLDMSNTKKNEHRIQTILNKGYLFAHEDGTTERQKRALRSPSQVRVHKAVFTSLDVEEVRRRVGYGADFGKEVIIAQMEARYGLALSSTLEIVDFKGKGINFTFDVMPDYGIERTHDIRVWDEKADGGKGNLVTIKDDTRMYEPLDGQGTILPTAAVKIAHSLRLISTKEKEFLLTWLGIYNQDLRIPVKKGKDAFLKVWSKIPSAFQIRFGFAKGLLVVHAHNLETMDCNQSTYREDGKIMSFYDKKGDLVEETNEAGETVKRRYYDFNRDIMFTDSMWKENFDPAYLLDADSDIPADHRANFEIVLWQKNRASDNIFMGYQYWQALPGIDAKKFAAAKVKEMNDTIFTDWKEAMLFLGQYDTGRNADDYENKADEANGKIQKVILALNENPEVLQERWIQEVLKDTREKYVEDMKTGRIPVEGANPYVITSPECQFGRESLLKKGEYYYNRETSTYALFRSPLIHESEVVVATTVDVADYHGFYQDILIINPFDDTLPRMGGADTDGDKVAMVKNETIISYAKTGLPMLFDEGRKGSKQANTRSFIWHYDCTTILAQIMSIGELTNMATTWKDIAQFPKKMNELGLTPELIDRNVCILRFSQGTSIDYAKTGFFFQPPAYAITQLSPKWKPWSQKAAEFGIPGAEVYASNSNMGRLHRAIKKYLKEDFKNESAPTRDFSIEFSEGADYEEIERVKPIVEELESNYRNELRVLHDMSLDEEEQKEYVASIMDKYQHAMASIDSDIASVAAAAYMVSYYGSASKSRKVSFPWITCFEGLMMNLSQSGTHKQKLRRVKFDGHIDDIPQQIKVYRNEAKGDQYHIKVTAPNGTYETFRKYGKLYIVMAAKSLAKNLAKKRVVVEEVERSIVFMINSFGYNDSSATEVVELLNANEGVMHIQKIKDTNQTVNSLHAGVWIGGKRIGNVNRQQKGTLAPFLSDGAVEFKVQNLDDLSPTYTKDKQELEHKFFTLACTFKQKITVDVPADQEIVSSSQYEGDDTGIPVYTDEEAPQQEAVVHMDYDIEIDTDDVEESIAPIQFDQAIVEKISAKGDYWNNVIDPADLHIVGGSVERIGAIKIGQPCIKVVLHAQKGNAKRTLEATVAPQKGGTFVIESMSTKGGEKIQSLILQLAHYEIYMDMVVRKQA